MWTLTSNGEPIQPPKKEVSGNYVIIRKDFKLIPVTEEFPEHYEYLEWQMTKEQYDVYKDFEEKLNEQDDALIELASLISEVI